MSAAATAPYPLCCAQVATYHYDIKPLSTPNFSKESGGLQIRDSGQSSDWKLFLVQVGAVRRFAFQGGPCCWQSKCAS